MSKLNVKNGTPVGNAHLCKNCTWGQVITGYRESDLLVICTATSPNIAVPFTVYDCTAFNDKHKPTYAQMKSLAIEVQPTRVSTCMAGFSTVTKVQPIRRTDDDDDKDEGEVARIR